MKTVKVIYPGPGVEGEARRGACFYSLFELQLEPPKRAGQPIEIPERHYEELLRLGIVEDVPEVKERKEAAAREEAEKRRRDAAAAVEASKKDAARKEARPRAGAGAGEQAAGRKES